MNSQCSHLDRDRDRHRHRHRQNESSSDDEDLVPVLKPRMHNRGNPPRNNDGDGDKSVECHDSFTSLQRYLDANENNYDDGGGNECKNDYGDENDTVVDKATAYIDDRYRTRSFAEGKLVEIMERCWVYDPVKRADIFEVVRFLRDAVEENNALQLIRQTN